MAAVLTLGVGVVVAAAMVDLVFEVIGYVLTLGVMVSPMVV